MEKATRERLTGAVIFFAVLAIAVPELLTGPGERDAAQDPAALADTGPPLTTYDLALDPAAAPGQRHQQELAATAPAQSEAIAQAVPPPVTAQLRDVAPPAAAAPEPVPGQTATEAPGVAQARAPAGQEDAGRATAAAPAPGNTPATQAAARPPPGATPAAPRTAATGSWWVQLGSFSSQDNAQRLARELRGKGFTVQVSQVTSGGTQLHRVRAGPEADRAAATALRERLAAAGTRGTLVPP